MTQKLLTLVAVLALATFGLAACGDDDDSGNGETTAAEETEQTTEEAPAEEPEGGSGGSLEFTADPSGALAYEEDSAETTAGTVNITLVNESQVPHDVRIEDSSGEDLGGTDVITNDTAEATVELEAGEYTFFCSVPGHRQAGMEGALTVN